MRLTAWGMIGLVALALLLIAGVVLGTAAPASCGDADDSRKHDVLGEAEKAYGAILADEPSSECARRGMVMALERRCTLAAATKQAGRRDDAEKMLVAALAVEPSILLDAPKDSESQQQVEARGAVRKCLVDALAGIAAEKKKEEEEEAKTSADEEDGNAPAACPCTCTATCNDAKRPRDTEPTGSKRNGKAEPTPDPTETPDSTETPEPTVTPDSTQTPEPTPHRTPSADCSATRC